MSSLNQFTLLETVKRQYHLKLKAYHHLIASLVLFQGLALFFALLGESSTSILINQLTITTNIFSANIVIFFTFIWVFTLSFYMTSKASKNMMFLFITNKLSNHLANLLFMLTASLIGAVTSVLLGYTLKAGLMLYYGMNHQLFFESVTIGQLFITILTTFLYHILIFSFGYLIGEMIQLHSSFVFIVPLLLLSLLITSINQYGEPPFITYFLFENNLLLFTFKVVIVTAICWLIASQIGRRLEVRKG